MILINIFLFHVYAPNFLSVSVPSALWEAERTEEFSFYFRTFHPRFPLE